MRKIIAIIMVMGFIVSCETKGTAKENVKLIDKYVEAVENLDYDAMDNLLDDNYVGVGPSRGDSINKTDAIANWKNNVENLYESIHYSKSQNIAVQTPEGQWVSNWADLTIVYKQSKKEISILTNTVYLIQKGKIVRSISFYNEADALEQLGYVFINPEDI